jgi:hypothetical protein
MGLEMAVGDSCFDRDRTVRFDPERPSGFDRDHGSAELFATTV